MTVIAFISFLAFSCAYLLSWSLTGSVMLLARSLLFFAIDSFSTNSTLYFHYPHPPENLVFPLSVTAILTNTSNDAQVNILHWSVFVIFGAFSAIMRSCRNVIPVCNFVLSSLFLMSGTVHPKVDNWFKYIYQQIYFFWNIFWTSFLGGREEKMLEGQIAFGISFFFGCRLCTYFK